jgi:tripartite-type tricarboxylate transporter receptor subunit TctC
MLRVARGIERLLLSAAIALVPSLAVSQTFPSRPVVLVVPNAPAGAMDMLARILQAPLQTLWKQTVVVDYKPGGSTAVGTDFVAKATPDGYTLGVVNAPHVINPAMRKLPFDTVKDLSGVAFIGDSSSVISATPSLPANTLAEMIELVRKSPGKYSYASPGVGSSTHLAMELLKQQAGLDLLHVPFKGSGPAYPEVMSGRVELLCDPMFPTLNHVAAGKLKALALTGPKRSSVAPSLPTVSETLPGFGVTSLYGIVVASGAPRELVRKLHADLSVVLQSPEVRKVLVERGIEPRGLSPEQFDDLIRNEVERWAKVVKVANIPTE